MSESRQNKKLQNRSIKTPYLEIDLEKVKESYNKFKKYLRGIEIFYAMKCNPNLEIMKTILKCGGQFEISSANELQKAIKVGADPKKILFSNPIKTLDDIKIAYKLGVNYFAFDSNSEIDKLAFGAPGSNVYVRIAIPVRKSVVASEGKFGVSIDQARDLMLYAKERGLKPYGISFHVGSQMLDYESWGYAIQHSAKLINILKKDKIYLKFLDIGGGFPVCYEDVKCDNLDKASKIVFDAIEKYVPKNVRIVVEPGRYLVAESGTMISTVIGMAERFDRKWLHLDVGADNGLMEAIQTANTLVFPVHDNKQSDEKDIFAITGPTCDSQDTILFDVPLSSDIEVGDRVYIEFTGAYSTAFTNNFNGFPSPEICVKSKR